MGVDFETASPTFREFYEAFSPLTFGRSMGRAADHAMVLYDTFTEEERTLATDWFLELFGKEQPHWGFQYLYVIEKMGDPRFIPLLEAYCKRLKMRHRKPVRAELNGETVTVRPSFRSEIQLCKQVIRTLKHQRA